MGMRLICVFVDFPIASLMRRYETNEGEARAFPYRSESTGYQRSYQENPGLEGVKISVVYETEERDVTHEFAC